jgi:YNFM family putative membrane transporter
MSLADPRIRRGDGRFVRTNIALFLSGFVTFALLYEVQPLLPIFAGEFGIDAGTSSLSLSLTSAVLAASLLLASVAADRWGRKRVMGVSLGSAALLGLLTPLMPNWHAILAVRTLMGLALSGVPAVALVYLAEEMEPSSFGFSVGLYIGGNAIGGMSGRLLVGFLTDLTSWRIALFGIGLASVVSAILFWRLLPRPNAVPRPASAGSIWRNIGLQFRDAAIPLLFAEAFLIMGAFVNLYNYIGFRLAEPPYGLSQSAVALIFLLYLIGTGASTWIGGVAGRLGRRRILWLMIAIMAAGVGLTCLSPLPAIVAGVAVATFGFFGAHSIASSWVSRRAREGRAQASSLYLFSYYLGASVIGSAGGYGWSGWGWPGVAAVSLASLGVAGAISLRLFFVIPLPEPETPVVAAAGG